MKRILLASASIVAFAGAAAAEITFSGDATLGYNDTQAQADPIADDDLGFYWDAGLDVTFTQALDNGLTASASFGLNVADGNLGEPTESSNFVLSLTSDTAGLFFGNTKFAAETHWTGAGEMDADGFSKEDGEVVLRGDITYGGVEASVSYAIADDAVTGEDDSLEQLSLGADATFGTISVAFGYQEETEYLGEGGDFNSNQVMGVSAGTSFAGADIRLAYAQESMTTPDLSRQSIGISASYPFGPVTLGAYYVMESGDVFGSDPEDSDSYGITADYASGPLSVSASYEVDQEDDGLNDQTEDFEVTGSYDVGNGITAYAGVVDSGEDFYVAGSIALGEGATLLVSYVDDGDNDDDDDEVGPEDYKEGATVELGFSF